jgi:hypothetical protein
MQKKSGPIRFIYIMAVCSLAGILSCNPRIEFSPEIEAKLPQKIDFNYHIKPILSDRCFVCHGPDQTQQKAGLRLDTPEGAFAALQEGEGHAIVPGKATKSALFRRITSNDPKMMMPPLESNLKLNELEIAMLTRWIDQGAAYKPHWSFIAPERPEIPAVNNPAWVHNPIDYFVLHRLERENLLPASVAEKEQLLRRVSFDLTGLPPTLEEIDAFVADQSEDAYEKVLDRLLASPHYGERMAMDWMDLARYADSHGYHADGYRLMWPWRDWVIQAFNDNMAFDQFTTWQMAGDLLPEATQEQKLATGFHRNHPASSESGIVPEEYLLENVFDRTNTTAKAFLGLTLECARCHDHKYDPISQREYFQFSAFFNNVNELGMISNDGNAAPLMPLMSEETNKQITYLKKRIAKQEAEQVKQARQFIQQAPVNTRVDPEYAKRGLIGHYPLDELYQEKTANLASGGKRATIGGEVQIVPGKQGNAIRFDSEYESLNLSGIGDFERTDQFSMGAWVKPEVREDYSVIMGNAGGKNSHWRGYEMFLDSLNRVSVRLTHEPPGHRLEVITNDSIKVKAWSHVMFTYDGSSKASGLQIYLNGSQVPTTTVHNNLNNSIRTIDGYLTLKPMPIRLGRSYRAALDIGLFKGAIDEVRVYQRRLTGLEVAGVTGNPFWEEKPYERLDEAEKEMLAEYDLYRKPHFQQRLAQLAELREKEQAIMDTIPEVMVMEEMDPPRKTYVLERGVYDAPTEEVTPSTLAKVLPFAEDLPQNRLGLTRWLLNPENPLTARVIVNRFWYMFFGRGLVRTLDDFGNQGDLPTHPELLDWLAMEFVASGWDVKALLRLMATSATYRQSSKASAALMEKDPDNILLARGPRYKLPAEMIRDNALVASGLLVDKIGGPSVKTYQPEGLWSKTHFSRLLEDYQPDSGDKLYRRSLYTFIRRTAPPATMTTFDASDRSMCVVRRQVTDTPLQSLLLLNETQMIECARLIAERAIREGGQNTPEQLDYAFRLLTSRHLTGDELNVLQGLFNEEYEKYSDNLKAAEELLTVGEYPRDVHLELPAVAALTVASNIMMNYDEVYTKR